MKVAVIGAAGGLCSRVVAEALRRGHRVTALTEAAVDATDSAAVATLLAGHRRQDADTDRTYITALSPQGARAAHRPLPHRDRRVPRRCRRPLLRLRGGHSRTHP